MRITPGIGHNLKLIMGFSKHRCTCVGIDSNDSKLTPYIRVYIDNRCDNSLANTTSSSRLQCSEHYDSGIISGLGADVHMELIR